MHSRQSKRARLGATGAQCGPRSWFLSSLARRDMMGRTAQCLTRSPQAVLARMPWHIPRGASVHHAHTCTCKPASPPALPLTSFKCVKNAISSTWMRVAATPMCLRRTEGWSRLVPGCSACRCHPLYGCLLLLYLLIYRSHTVDPGADRMAAAAVAGGLWLPGCLECGNDTLHCPACSPPGVRRLPS